MMEVGLICCDTLAVCTQKIITIAMDALTLAEDIVAAVEAMSAAAIIEAVKAGLQIAMDLVVPDCINT